MVTQKIVETGDQACDQALVHEYRATAFSIKIHSDPFLEHLTYTDYLNLTQADPLGFFAYSQRSWLKGVQEQEQSSWYSDLQHRLLILVALLANFKNAAEMQDAAGLREGQTLFLYAMNKVSDFVRGPVARDNTEVAQAVMEVYLPTVLEELGVGLKPADGVTGVPWNHCSNLLPGAVLVKGSADADFEVVSE